MKIIVIGSSILETTCQIKGSFKEGDNVILDNRIETGGGVAGNIAYVLGKWGAEPYICGVIGYDANNEKIKKEFTNFKVNIDFLETEAYNNKKINNHITPTIKTDVSRLKNFITTDAINKKRTSDDISNILEIHKMSYLP